MCLAIPARVVALEPEAQIAIVAFGNVKKRISTALLETVAVNDYVLVHVGFALNLVSEEEAEATLKLMADAGIVAEEQAA
jgi:hydrogenase expression/formation protein HypC